MSNWRATFSQVVKDRTFSVCERQQLLDEQFQRKWWKHSRRTFVGTTVHCQMSKSWIWHVCQHRVFNMHWGGSVLCGIGWWRRCRENPSLRIKTSEHWGCGCCVHKLWGFAIIVLKIKNDPMTLSCLTTFPAVPEPQMQVHRWLSTHRRIWFSTSLLHD